MAPSSQESLRYFEDVTVGEELAGLAVTVSRPQLFLFSAATNNAHRIHYDRLWAIETEGLRDVVVHGPLQGALMARVATDWMGPGGRMTSYSVRHEAPAFADDTIAVTGQVVAKHEENGVGVVDISLQETGSEGTRLGQCRVSVALPIRGPLG
jgi:hydroxyacyl-ACP dehydratase HTD2-like protein with hotdog domain